MRIKFPITAFSVLICFFLTAQQTISGSVETECGVPVTNALVSLTGDSLLTEVTNNNGFFAFSLNETGDSFVIRPTKYDVESNCITVWDKIILKKHLMGLSNLNSPYKVIAADLDKDQSLTVLDEDRFADLILGNTEQDSSERWYFLPADYIFPNPVEPFLETLPDSIFSAGGSLNNQFIGVKAGDLSCLNASVPTMVGISIPDTSVCAGESFRLPILVENFINITGLQFTVGWDTTLIQLDSITNIGLAGADSSSLNLLNPGFFTFLWDSQEATDTSLIDGSSIMDLHFTAKMEDSIAVSIDFLDFPTPFEIVDTTLAVFTKGANIIGSGVTINNCDTMDCMLSFDFVMDSCGVFTFTASNLSLENYTWNFGDSTTIDSTLTPVHIFETPGMYEVCLSALGCQDTFCMTIDATMVADSIAPVFSICPDSTLLILVDCGNFDGSVAYQIMATDNCDENLMIVSSHPADEPDVFVLDSTIQVVCTATDNAGNMAMCSFSVRVENNPMSDLEITCPSESMAIVNQNCEAMVPELDIEVTGGCPGYQIVQTPLPGTMISASTMISITVTDSTGNMKSCEVMLMVPEGCACNGSLSTNTFSTYFSPENNLLGSGNLLVGAIESAPGNYAILGLSPDSSLDGNLGLLFAKADSIGNLIMAPKRVDLGGFDILPDPITTFFAQSIVDTTYAVAVNALTGDSSIEPVVGKLDQDGCVIWAKRLDGLNKEFSTIRQLISTPQGGLICLISTQESGLTPTDFIIVSFNAQGAIMNQVDYHPASGMDGLPNFEPVDIIALENPPLGNASYAVAGNLSKENTLNLSLGILLLDNALQPLNGGTVFEYQPDAEEISFTPTKLTQSNDLLFVAGQKNETDSLAKGMIIALPLNDSTGLSAEYRWAQEFSYSDIDNNNFYDIAASNNGTIAVLGNLEDTIGQSSAYLMLLDREGVILGYNAYNDDNIFNKLGTHVTATSDNGFLISGFNELLPNTDAYWLAKTSPEGYLNDCGCFTPIDLNAKMLTALAGSEQYTTGTPNASGVDVNGNCAEIAVVQEFCDQHNNNECEIDFLFSVDDCGEVQFTLSDSTLTNLTWDFGDGNTVDNQIAPSHLYLASGTYNVCVTANDSTCMNTVCYEVEVQADTIAPSFVQCPDVILLAAGPCQDSLVVAYAISAVDNCDDSVTIESNLPSGSRFPLGNTMVICTATDKAGNTDTCSFMVTVEGNFPDFQLNCPDSLIVSLDGDCNGTVPLINQEMLGMTTGCPPYVITQSIEAGTAIDSDTMIMVRVMENNPTDTLLSVDSCMIRLVIKDTTTPVLNCPDDVIVNLPPNLTGTTVEFSNIIVMDNCSATLECNYNSGDFFPCGTTTVTCVATDMAGNQTTCSFDVVVVCDTTCCRDITEFNNRVDEGFDIVKNGCDVQIKPKNLDECHLVQYTWGDGDTSMVVSGADSLMHSYSTDGNYMLCVTIQEFNAFDTINPICWQRDTCINLCLSCDTTGISLNITCPDDLEVMAPIGSDSIPVFYKAPIVRNLCDRIVTCDIPSGSLFPIGMTTVTCTVIDTIMQDTLSCSFNISVVQDTMGMMGQCDSLSVNIFSEGTSGDTCCYNVSLINNSSGMNLGAVLFEMPRPNRFYSLTTMLEGWQVQLDSTGTFGVLIAPDSIVPSGNLGVVARFCADSRIVSPNTVFTSWISQTGDLFLPVCQDTLVLDCVKEVCADNPMEIMVQKLKDEDCGLSNGSATVNLSGGTGPYTFEWSNGETDQTAVALDFNTHFVTVTDANGCIALGSVVIDFTEIFFISDATVRNEECNHLGSIELTLEGGAGPYSFQWSTGDTTAIIDELPAGTFAVTVTDFNGCQASSEYQVFTGPDTLVLNLLPTEDFCGLEVFPQNGLAPYQISWSNGASTMNSGNLILDASYTVTVSDSDGCLSEMEIISEVGAPSSAFSFEIEDLTVSFTSTNTTGSNFWDFGNGFSSALKNPEFIYANSGSYQVMHITTNECGKDTTIQTVVILEPSSNNELEIIKGFNLYPNPTQNLLTVEIISDQAVEGDLLIYNLFGQQVYFSSGEKVDQDFRKQIDVSALPASTYILAFKAQEKMVYKRFIVQH